MKNPHVNGDPMLHTGFSVSLEEVLGCDGAVGWSEKADIGISKRGRCQKLPLDLRITGIFFF